MKDEEGKARSDLSRAFVILLVVSALVIVLMVLLLFWRAYSG